MSAFPSLTADRCARLHRFSRLRTAARSGSRTRRQAGPRTCYVAHNRGTACLRLLFCAAALALVLTGPAAAQGPSADSAVAQAEKSTTRIEIDNESDVIRFVIEGEERAVLDTEGLHINGSIDYGGTLTDYGLNGFDDPADWKDDEQRGAGGSDAR